MFNPWLLISVVAALPRWALRGESHPLCPIDQSLVTSTATKKGRIICASSRSSSLRLCASVVQHSSFLGRRAGGRGKLAHHMSRGHESKRSRHEGSGAEAGIAV